MIIPFNNPLMIPKLIELAEIVPNTPIEKLKKFMFMTLNQPNTKAYVAKEDDMYKGFIYASIEEFDGDRCIFIQFCVILPDEYAKYTGWELLTKMKVWAQENGITQIYFSTQRDPKGFMRKYHFEFYSTILKLDLTKEKSHE